MLYVLTVINFFVHQFHQRSVCFTRNIVLIDDVCKLDTQFFGFGEVCGINICIIVNMGFALLFFVKFAPTSVGIPGIV